MAHASPRRKPVTVDASKLTAKLGAAELAAREPIRATKPMPAEMREMLRQDAEFYIRADHKSKITLAETPVDKDWSRVTLRGGGSSLLTDLPGKAQLFGPEPSAAAGTRHHATESHRPAWLDLEYMPKLVPFKQS